MLNRIMASLDSPRRHLAFLVSLLVLVFALAGAVAYRAMEAERSRSAAVAGVIERGVERAVGEWASMYHRGTMDAARGLAVLVVDSLRATAALSVGTVRAAAPAGLLCDICNFHPEVAYVFEADPAARTVTAGGAQFDTAVALEALAALVSDDSPGFNNHVRAIVYHGGASGPPHAVVVVGVAAEREGALTRAFGIGLTRETTQEILRATYVRAQMLTGTETLVGGVDSLYSRAAFIGDVQVMGDRVVAGQKNAPRSPIYGIDMMVGLREEYASDAYDSATKLIAILALLVLIGGLLVIATVAIRRETVLMRMRADFVSGVSHELRTPLAQIRMFVETLLLGRTRTDLERQRSLEIIEQEARRLSHLVENVLLFSKTEGGRRPRIAPEPVDFAGDIRRAVDSFTLLSRAREAEVRAELQENITVQVDRGALRQILVNLIDNALKYGPPGQRVTVGAALFDDVARVWVDDEGPGIPDEARARIFESFYRLPRERRKHVAGSGIGLAVVRELARLHGGDVWAENAPGGGARIVVQFPDAYLRSQTADAMAAAS